MCETTSGNRVVNLSRQGFTLRRLGDKTSVVHARPKANAIWVPKIAPAKKSWDFGGLSYRRASEPRRFLPKLQFRCDRHSIG